MKNLFGDLPSLSYIAGEILIRPGEPLDYVFWVEQGFVRQYSVSTKGEELTVYIYPPNSGFFWGWLMGVRENNYYFETVTRATIKKIRITELWKQIDRDGEMGKQLLQLGFLSLAMMMVHMEALVYGNASRKVASVLSILVWWYGKPFKGEFKILLPLTHQLLSTMVGMTRETTSIALGEFKRYGVIRQQGRYMIVSDKDRLLQEAEIVLTPFANNRISGLF